VRRRATTFLGVDLGGGKGKNTAVARLVEAEDGASVTVTDYGTGRDTPFYDTQLVAYLREHPDAIVAIDAPLTMPACVRCTRPTCPTVERCDVPVVAWFRARANRPPAPLGREEVVRLEPTNGKAAAARQHKPRYTTYTQRAAEVLLHEEQSILPRETLGQGMGPLASRGVYLVRALADVFALNETLIEVYPKATITQLFSARVAARYKRSAESPAMRLEILNGLPSLRFAPGAWREDGLANDHKFDAIMCAYTAWLYTRGLCVAPTDPVVADDGWIWIPAPKSA
jgi:predicted nuclease with RNAse H fold